MFLQGRFDPKKNYKVFLSTQGRNQLNLPSELIEAAKAFANAGDWSLRAWRTLLQDIWHLINKELEKNHNKRFYSSAKFLECHALLLAKKEAKRVAREVGTKDIKSIENTIRALAMSETRKATKIVEDSQRRQAQWDAAARNEKPATVLDWIRKKLRLK